MQAGEVYGAVAQEWHTVPDACVCIVLHEVRQQNDQRGIFCHERTFIEH